jgi:hypothetical protein
MTQLSEKKTPAQMVEAIFKLDLDPIKLKLMDKNEGHGWTRSEADRYELEYKRFLALLAKFPDEVIAPNTSVDKFWHGHILDTMKYAEDCQHVFGYFLHHFPYFGMRDEEDAANLASAAVNMQRLYRQEFGEPQAQESSYCGAAVPGRKEQPAYCGAASGKEERQLAQSAYCGLVAGKGRPRLVDATAYCGVAKASFCGAAIEKVEAKPEQEAYCGAASTSYCGAAGEERQQAESTAYCGVAKPGYCGASIEKVNAKQEQTAYCGIANVSYCGVVAGKGRPKLNAATEICPA